MESVWFFSGVTSIVLYVLLLVSIHLCLLSILACLISMISYQALPFSGFSFILSLYISHTPKTIQYLSFSFILILPNTIISRSINVATNGMSHLCINTTFSFFFLYLVSIIFIFIYFLAYLFLHSIWFLPSDVIPIFILPLAKHPWSTIIIYCVLPSTFCFWLF